MKKPCQAVGSHGLPVLLIGGHAVVAHGHPPNTFDIDFVIELKDQERGIPNGIQEVRSSTPLGSPSCTSARISLVQAPRH